MQIRPHNFHDLRSLRNLLLVALVAAFCFGGSFTCKASKHDDDGGGSSVSVNL